MAVARPPPALTLPLTPDSFIQLPTWEAYWTASRLSHTSPAEHLTFEICFSSIFPIPGNGSSILLALKRLQPVRHSGLLFFWHLKSNLLAKIVDSVFRTTSYLSHHLHCGPSHRHLSSVCCNTLLMSLPASTLFITPSSHHLHHFLE